MAEITRFLGMSIGFCEDFNANAHVHVYYNQHHCVIGADNFSIFSGSLPPRVASLAIEWVMTHNEMIKQNWEIHKSGSNSLAYIPPLVE